MKIKFVILAFIIFIPTYPQPVLSSSTRSSVFYFFEHIKTGNLEKVQEYIMHDRNFLYATYLETTPLEWAAEWSRFPILLYLAQKRVTGHMDQALGSLTPI